jgi:hypothetical protein
MIGTKVSQQRFFMVKNLADSALGISRNNADAYALRARAQVGIKQFWEAI